MVQDVIEDVEKEDVELICFLNKQIGRFRNSGKINTRLALNQLIILHNVFSDKMPGLLFEKTPEERWSTLSTMMRHLDYLPEEVEVGERKIKTESIMVDDSILFELSK